ncbi:hypothetical protein VOLCADRAFT_98381 [Volvox carteri f. nagariensis]|uniref:DUF1995 domain-containing protein n=1 Tax=Volvox carteri f. nagariensis TaxID=3068 RepID=D8UF71_VOLCA|nr:uncharacterized protein VOLCADRAFT_98381 [Volvox carteri f. nagariensis]EFJ41630.1 hypothetical protein VOLCADRAFT_98381 [Volvox carteri f. nagariensis]|eukprot:XP_002957286.1 hypothetical protein VOLCADRAFT_98381 [Volvox carteri f. nagariensis]
MEKVARQISCNRSCGVLEGVLQDEAPSTSYDAADRATLLRKFTVHATSSRRLQGLADAGLMLLALLPTVLLRLIRAAMGLLGITEHRWRGISMVVPLTLEDRTQIEVAVRNLAAGRLGRRPEPPRRGPVSPAQQLLLDTHAILAAAATTATAFSLPYDGMPHAALQAKLASYLRGVAAAEDVCTQDCLKQMRKMARKTLMALCAAAPQFPVDASANPGCGSNSSSSFFQTPKRTSSVSSTIHMVSRPKPRAVATAFMAACLLELSRSQPETLIHLVARLPDGDGDLVETMTLVPLAPGAEYLRLLAAASDEPHRFEEQLEAAMEFGRLRPSDAKKENAMQGLTINARVHGVGVVRYGALGAAAAAATASASPGCLQGLGNSSSSNSGSGKAMLSGVQGPGNKRQENQGQGQGRGQRQGQQQQQKEEVEQQTQRTGLGAKTGAQTGGFTACGEDRDDGAEDDGRAGWSTRPGANGAAPSAVAVAEASNGTAGHSQRRRPDGAVDARTIAWGGGDDDVGGGGDGTAGGDDSRTLAGAHRNGGGGGGDGDSVSSDEGGGDEADTEELLGGARKQKNLGAAADSDSTQPTTSTTTTTTPAASHPAPPTGSRKAFGLVLGLVATASRRAIGLPPVNPSKKAAAAQAASYVASRSSAEGSSGSSNGGGNSGGQQQTLRAKPPSFTAASGPSTCIMLYPTAALDVFQAVYSCPRSGAFAAHGRSPRGVGLSRLAAVYTACHALPASEQGALLGRLGYGNPEELRAEVELRKALCVAQAPLPPALPVVIASLRLMCGSAACLRAACRTGSFLHVQQSLLSDLHRHERGYLEDTKGALDALGDKLAVRFVEGSEKVLPLHVSGNCITVSLPTDCVSATALSEAGIDRATFCGATYGLTPLLFNMGINSLQSLGFLTWRGPGEPLQDILNRHVRRWHSLERLNEYAVRAGAAGGPHLSALNRHYSPQGHRHAKDTAMFSLVGLAGGGVRRACAEVGGGRAVNCKSGKDRTALELSKALAEEAVAAGLLPQGQVTWLEGQFLRGLSYMSTSQNHGQPPAYAFNEMEIATLPPGWRPDWRLCGKTCDRRALPDTRVFPFSSLLAASDVARWCLVTLVAWATTDESVTQFDVDVSAAADSAAEDLGPRDDDVLPNSLADSIDEAAKATAEAIQRGNVRCQVELHLPEFWDPISGPIFPNRGDQDRFWRMTRRFLEQLGLALNSSGYIKAVYPDAGVAAMLSHQWQDRAFNISSLNDRRPVDADDELVVVACVDPPGAEDCIRLVRQIREQDEQAGGLDRPIVLFNQRMSSGDVGLGLNARRIRNEFLKNFTVSYSLRPIGDIGTVFRRYPGQWKVFVEEENLPGRYRLIKESPTRPQGEALDFLIREALMGVEPGAAAGGGDGGEGASGTKQGPSLLVQLSRTVTSLSYFMKSLKN